MFCDFCKYENINHIKLYNTIVDECSKCEYCSISLSNYFDFINDIIISNHFLGINIFTIIDMLPRKHQIKYQMLYECFSINLNELNETNRKCRICGEYLFEIKKSNNFSLYICKNCMNVFFNKEKIKEYVEEKIKFIHKYYYFIIIRKRFLQLIERRGKNNV